MHHFISFLLRAAYAVGFGFILTFHPEDIVQYIPQLLGGVLMLETIAQLLELLMLKIKTKVNKWFFLVPGVVLIYSLILILFCTSEFNGDTTLREAFTPSNGMSWTTWRLADGATQRTSSSWPGASQADGGVPPFPSSTCCAARSPRPRTMPGSRCCPPRTWRSSAKESPT